MEGSVDAKIMLRFVKHCWIRIYSVLNFEMFELGGNKIFVVREVEMFFQ